MPYNIDENLSRSHTLLLELKLLCFLWQDNSSVHIHCHQTFALPANKIKIETRLHYFSNVYIWGVPSSQHNEQNLKSTQKQTQKYKRAQRPSNARFVFFCCPSQRGSKGAHDILSSCRLVWKCMTGYHGCNSVSAEEIQLWINWVDAELKQTHQSFCSFPLFNY